MKNDKQGLRSRLVVIQGGGGLRQGPITRLGLMERLALPSQRQVAWLIFSKILLLASVLYVIYG